MDITGNLSIVVILFFAAILFVAGLVHGTLGLGFPLVATPLLALFVDVRSAILITLLPTAAVNVASIIRGGHWRDSVGLYWPLAAFALIGGIAGSTLIVVGDPAPFKLVLAGLILLYLASGKLGSFKMAWVARHRGGSMLVFGLVAGVSAGSTNVMVPILIIYALEMGLHTKAMVQVFNLCFLAGKISQIVVFAAAGMLTTQVLLFTIPLAGVALAALLIGMVFRDRISGDTFRTLIRWVLFVIALVLIGQYVIAG